MQLALAHGGLALRAQRQFRDGTVRRGGRQRYHGSLGGQGAGLRGKHPGQLLRGPVPEADPGALNA